MRIGSPRLADKTWRHISLKYRAALSLVAIMIVLIAVASGLLISAQHDNFQNIYFAGKERTGTQHVAVLVHQLMQTTDTSRAKILENLKDDVNMIETFNQRLIDDEKIHDEGEIETQQLHDIYYASPMNLVSLMNTYLIHAHNVLRLTPDQITETQADVRVLTALAADKMLTPLYAAIQHYEKETENNLAQLHHIILWLSGISLFILAAVSLLLMKPAIAYIAKAQERLTELDRLKSDFLANMSHEIRTPMNGIFGMTELLLDSELNPKQQHYVSTLQNSADHLLGLINDILDFSKLEAGHMKLDPIHFNLLATIEDVLELLSTRAREKNLELLLHYAPGTPRFVVADPGRIRQILFNLIGNAIKFTDKGYVIVHAEVKHVDEKGCDHRSWLKLRVEDTGIGIPEDKIASLFEKFMQVESGTTRARQGTGLGLAISRNLIQLMGGNIDAQSIPGAGTTFSWEIPLQETSEPYAEAPRLKQLLGKRALLVDDLAPNRLYFKETLISAGMECLTAENAQEALSILAYEHDSKRKVDVVLTDYMMPAMDGLELTNQIKQDDRFRPIPVMILTSVTSQGLTKLFDKVGAAACLDKPVTRQQLMDTMSHVIDAAQNGERMTIITAKSSNALSAKKLLTSDKSLAGTSILLVEDNRVNMEITSEILMQFGCRVVGAENGKLAIDAATTQRFDLILMDCQMPEMDGFEAARHLVTLKAEGKIAPVPIVALTANALKGDRERCLESGMDDYLSKPVRRTNLQALLLKWLREKIDQTEQAKQAAANAPAPTFDELQPANGGRMMRHPDEVDPIAFADAQETLGAKLGTVLGYFIQDAEGYIELIANAMQHNDPHGAIQPAHTLKSSSRQFGAMDLAALAERMETGARAKGSDTGIGDLAVLVPPMREAFAQVRPFFQSMITEN